MELGEQRSYWGETPRKGMEGNRTGQRELSDGGAHPTVCHGSTRSPGPRLSPEESSVGRNGWALGPASNLVIV